MAQTIDRPRRGRPSGKPPGGAIAGRRLDQAPQRSPQSIFIGKGRPEALEQGTITQSFQLPSSEEAEREQPGRPVRPEGSDQPRPGEAGLKQAGRRSAHRALD